MMHVCSVGFESGRFIGYEEKQRKKKLNLTAIFKSTIFSFFFFFAFCSKMSGFRHTEKCFADVCIFMCIIL